MAIPFIITGYNHKTDRIIARSQKGHKRILGPSRRPYKPLLALSLKCTALGLINRLNPDGMGCYWTPLTSR
jgi:hypothetical protein